MDSNARRLGAVVAAAIGQQLPSSSDVDPEEDRIAQRQTADRLVAEALAAGRIDGVHVAELDKFSAGHTAMLVARVRTSLSFVVKVDRSADLVAEAHLLRRLGSDPVLPVVTRHAFPRIYGIDHEGPIYGYLMEDLAAFTPLSTCLSEDRPGALRRVVEVWREVLEPAYRATRSTRLSPNVREDYFHRARSRLDQAVGRGLLPSPTVPFNLAWRSNQLELADGWGNVMDRASDLLGKVVPPFSTFVHGDPNPENILWRDDAQGGCEFRLIDPKLWLSGDYLFDVAKIAHYVMVTAPLAQNGGAAQLSFDGPVSSLTYSRDTIEYDDRWLLAEVEPFANDSIAPDCPDWQIRYQLAVAANLLGIAAPRLQRDESVLGLTAFAEGLRMLMELPLG